MPLLRLGRSIGVLVVQNRTKRQYIEEEEEALQTAAMVLAEVIASGDMKELAQAGEAEAARQRSHHLRGESIAEGLALGHVVLHEPRVVITNLIAESIPDEKRRLEEGIAALRQQVDTLIGRLSLGEGGEHDEVLETFRMFAHDRGWVRRIREAVETGLTAEAAVERVQGENRARMMRQSDTYLRDRLHDLDDLANRLLRILTGQTGTAAQGQLPRDAIVVARTMGPAELLDYDRTRLRGLVLAESGTNSHVAIVARALGVPAVGHVLDIVELVETGDPIIVDGGLGEIHVRPSPGIEQAYAEKVRFYARRQAKYAELRHLPAVTLDGQRISAEHQCRADRRSAASFGFRRRRHRAVPDRAAIHAVAAVSAARAAGRTLCVGSGGCGGEAGGFPHPRYRLRQDACPISMCRARTIRRLAGGQSVMRWSVRRCFGCRRGRCSGRDPAAIFGSCFRWWLKSLSSSMRGRRCWRSGPFSKGRAIRRRARSCLAR